MFEDENDESAGAETDSLWLTGDGWQLFHPAERSYGVWGDENTVTCIRPYRALCAGNDI